MKKIGQGLKKMGRKEARATKMKSDAVLYKKRINDVLLIVQPFTI
jgi:hypothetical protein